LPSLFENIFLGLLNTIKIPDKQLRENRDVLKKLSLAPKYAKYERLSKRLEISDL